MARNDPALLRTQFSLRAQDLASTFNAAMGKVNLMPGGYVPELQAPEGVSTGGGVQALQRLRLVPQQAGFPTLVAGGVNQKDGTAELRDYAHVNAVHQQRFKRPIPLEKAQYDQFVRMAGEFFGVLRLRVSVVGPAAVLPDDSAAGIPAVPAKPAGPPWVLIGILVAVVVVAGVAVSLFVLR